MKNADMKKVGKSNVRKGKTLERRVAKLFTEWTGEEFRRRRVEGRDVTIIERDSTADVIPVNRESIFSIEVKSGSGFSFDALLANPESAKLTSWWHQSAYDAELMTELHKKKFHPILFFKPNSNWDWIMFPKEVIDKKILTPTTGKPNGKIWFQAILYEGYDLVGEISKNVSQSKKNPVMKALKLPAAYICRWSDFKDNINSASIFFK
jgi:hypothetical protein